MVNAVVFQFQSKGEKIVCLPRANPCVCDCEPGRKKLKSVCVCLGVNERGIWQGGILRVPIRESRSLRVWEEEDDEEGNEKNQTAFEKF